jgi:transposase InsO family protein
VTEHGFSQRRACRLIDFDRSTARYRRRRPDDTGLRARLRALAAERRRFGYRRLGVLLAREGLRVNHKKLYRLYREERLTVRRRGGRKRALGTRRPMTVPQAVNERCHLQAPRCEDHAELPESAACPDRRRLAQPRVQERKRLPYPLVQGPRVGTARKVLVTPRHNKPTVVVVIELDLRF